MKLRIEKYKEQIKGWPQSGHHIMAQYNDKEVIVYQSYRPEIGLFAEKNQYFGGAFSLNRMTWIKPNFLWMMYRNGWGRKEGQEIVLAIHLKRTTFERYLEKAVYSSFQKDIYNSHEEWRESVANSSIRLQWDPDHDPYGKKVERRAIQLGIRNDEIVKFAKEDILRIENISDFVKQQYLHVLHSELDKLMIPAERPYFPENVDVCDRLRIVRHDKFHFDR